MPLLTTFKSFEALDNCHKQIQQNLDALTALTNRLAEGGALDSSVRTQAEEIETFFSTVARNHHATEEQDVFPLLLMSEDAQTVTQVRSLIEDHFWIEKYWHDLSPILRAISQGLPLHDNTELANAAGRFLDLCNYHIESEESMIYPEAKARLSSLYHPRA